MIVRYLWTVRYRRSNWASSQARTFFTERSARRLVSRLLGQSRDWFEYSHLAPLAELKLTRRALGDEETLAEWMP